MFGGGQCCVYVCVDWSSGGLKTQAVTALYCSPCGYIRLNIKDGSEWKNRYWCTVFPLVLTSMSVSQTQQ